MNRYRDERQALAAAWSRRGQQDLPTRPAVAVADFQTSLSFEPDRTETRFLLGKALVAAHRPAEAGAELTTLLSDEPSRGDINLELGRIAAQAGDVGEAVRYYHAAIDGVWQTGAAEARRQARIELARLLMSNGQPVRAQAELIGLIDDLPPNAAVITDVASLLAKAGAQPRAIGLLHHAMDLDPQNALAAQAAATLEFNGGDLLSARRDFANAAKASPLTAANRETVDVINRALALDPYVEHLSVSVRAGRALRALAIAKARLERCPPMPELADRVDRAMKRRPADLERNADLIEETMAAAFDVERLPRGSCGVDSADDRALAIVDAQHTTRAQ